MRGSGTSEGVVWADPSRGGVLRAAGEGSGGQTAKAHMHEPGQWFASIAVTVTAGFPSDPGS